TETQTETQTQSATKPGASIVPPPPDSRPAQPAASPPAPPPPSLPPGTIRLTITTTPPDATIVVDGHRLGRTPYTGTFTPRGDTVWLKVRKRGHVPKKVEVPVTPDLTWDVTLPRRR
ncbi:MAG: PEGA domain-containing protein, partial [Deltaproteobacteria bacterium]|nr:PEGA domain-containing protein [Kofleriaceae bacterium]